MRLRRVVAYPSPTRRVHYGRVAGRSSRMGQTAWTVRKTFVNSWTHRKACNVAINAGRKANPPQEPIRGLVESLGGTGSGLPRSSCGGMGILLHSGSRWAACRTGARGIIGNRTTHHTGCRGRTKRGAAEVHAFPGPQRRGMTLPSECVSLNRPGFED